MIRTALASIGFGFSIFQFFGHLKHEQLLPRDSHAPQRFGTLLVGIGIMMLASGITYHLRFMYGLRVQRRQMVAQRLVHGDSAYPVSMTLIVALVLLLVGVLAFVGMLSVIPAIVLEKYLSNNVGVSLAPEYTYQGASFKAFVVAAAVAGSGDARGFPLLALAGAFLCHGHVAQPIPAG